MIVFILWWYLYTYDNGDEMKMMSTYLDDFNWWWLFWWMVMKRESYVFDLMIHLMMIIFFFIFLRWWLCLFDTVIWEHCMSVTDMCIEGVKSGIILSDEVKWHVNYVLVCLIESVISFDEFLYVKIWFDAYTWQSMNTMNLIVGDVMTSWCWSENWCAMIDFKIVFTWC